ncbi:hypothetical protein Tco_0768132 [Tanacetum coccineum]
MTIEKRKGIDLLSKVALTEEAQYEEVCKKSLRDFHKNRLSGSSIVTKLAPSAAKIKPFVTNEGTGAKPGVPDVTEKESTKSEAESWGRDKDDNNNGNASSSEGNDQESDSGDNNTQSDNEKGSDSEHETDESEMGFESDQEENEEEVDNDEEEKDDEFVKTPSNSTDDEDETNVESKAENKVVVNTDEGFIQKEGTDAEMINVQQGNENLEITLNQVIEDAHVTISTVIKKTEVPVTSSSYLSDLASKFLNFLDIPHTDAEIVSPIDVHVHHEILPKEVSNFAPLVIKSMITESLEHVFLAKESSQPQFIYEAATSLTKFELKKILIDKMDESQSYLTATENRECYNVLIKSYDLDKSLFSTYDKVYSLKGSQKDKDKDEDPSIGSDRRLKKKKTSKDTEPTKGLKTKESKSGSSKGTKSQSKSSRMFVHSEEPEFVVADSDMPQDQEENLATADKPSKTFDELMSTPIDFSSYIMNVLKITNLTQKTLLGPTFKLLKGTRTNFAKLEYNFEECYKALSEKLDWDNPKGGGISTMTYTTSITKTKYDLPSIKDMVPSIWSPIKVAYDKHAIWGISYWREQRKTFYGYARGLESSHNVYSTKLILAVTRVEHCECSPEAWLFKRESKIFSWESKVSRRINITKPETTRPGIRKRDPYTPYQDPQGFIYVDNQRRNRLMCSDELYKFSNGTLTRLQTSLDVITKNIRMEYLPHRIWSSLEKKRAHIIIKAIDKHLKERRMMRSFEKFVGGRHYEIDLRLLHQII